MKVDFDFFDFIPGFLGALINELAIWRPYFTRQPTQDDTVVTITWRHLIYSLLVLCIGSVVGSFSVTEWRIDSVIYGFAAAGIIQGTISISQIVSFVRSGN